MLYRYFFTVRPEYKAGPKVVNFYELISPAITNDEYKSMFVLNPDFATEAIEKDTFNFNLLLVQTRIKKYLHDKVCFLTSEKPLKKGTITRMMRSADNIEEFIKKLSV